MNAGRSNKQIGTSSNAVLQINVTGLQLQLESMVHEQGLGRRKRNIITGQASPSDAQSETPESRITLTNAVHYSRQCLPSKKRFKSLATIDVSTYVS